VVYLGKTETIKERSIYVYLPSTEQKKRWDECAEKQGTSISKFVIEHVENSLRQIEDSSYKSMGEVYREHRQLKERLDQAAREKHVLEIALEKLEEELKRYRAQPFLENQFFGVHGCQKELIKILRLNRLVTSEEVLSRLGIRPSDREAIKAISRQLELLEGYGLVRSSSKGWKWVEQ
jgi:hypothetical protein